MRARWFLLPLVFVSLALLTPTAKAQERSGGKALERIRGAVQKMRAEGKSETEILRALRDMADRALAQRGNAPAARPAPVRPGPRTARPGPAAERPRAPEGRPPMAPPSARGRRAGPPGQPGMLRRGPAAGGPPWAGRGQGRRGIGPQGPGPRGPAVLRPGAGGPPCPRCRSCPHCQSLGKPPLPGKGPAPEARKAPASPRGPAVRPAPPEAPQERAQLLRKARQHATATAQKMRAAGKSPEEIRAAMQRIRQRVRNAMSEMGPPPKARGAPGRG